MIWKNLQQRSTDMKNEKLQKIALTGVFAALSYVVFTFLQFRYLSPAEMRPPSIWVMRSVF